MEDVDIACCKRVPIVAMLDTIGRQKLVAAMRARGLSQTAVAASLKITQNSVSLWVRGLSRPEAHLRTALETVLGIPAADWLTDSEASILAEVRPITPLASEEEAK